MNSSITWSDKMGSRSRLAWLLLVQQDQVTVFTGQNVDGVVAVCGKDYRKNGKWSHTTYRMELAPGVRAISGHDGWETDRFVEGLKAATSHQSPIDMWTDVANALGVSVTSAMSFLRNWRPKAAAALDTVDAALTALDEAADEVQATEDTVTKIVSFGSPTRRERAEGFWTSPKPIPNYNGELRLINAGKGWDKDNIEIVGVLGTVISAQHSSGHGGGYVSVTVAIVPGTESEIPHFVSENEKAVQVCGLPEELLSAFGGDTDRARAFIKKVEELNVHMLDDHEMSCGRRRKGAEVIRVSGDPDFFLGADPNEVCDYILQSTGDTPVLEQVSQPDPTTAKPASVTDLMAKWGGR